MTLCVDTYLEDGELGYTVRLAESPVDGRYGFNWTEYLRGHRGRLLGALELTGEAFELSSDDLVRRGWTVRQWLNQLEDALEEYADMANTEPYEVELARDVPNWY